MEKKLQYKEIGDHLLYKLETEEGVLCVAVLHVSYTEDYHRYVEISSEEFDQINDENSLWDHLCKDMVFTPVNGLEHELYFTENPRDYAFI